MLRHCMYKKQKFFSNGKAWVNTDMYPQAVQAHSMTHGKENNMASNYTGLYGIFYKIPLEVVKVKILNKNTSNDARQGKPRQEIIKVR